MSTKIDMTAFEAVGKLAEAREYLGNERVAAFLEKIDAARKAKAEAEKVLIAALGKGKHTISGHKVVITATEATTRIVASYKEQIATFTEHHPEAEVEFVTINQEQLAAKERAARENPKFTYTVELQQTANKKVALRAA